MILGAGNGQLTFIRKCKAKGYKVIVVSVQGVYPGFELADKSYYVDTRDKEKILDIAIREKIDGILTDQTDVSVPTVAYVAEKLNLCGIGYDTALKFTDKYIMRSEAKRAGILVPKFERAMDVDDASKRIVDFNFPVMIKPTDSSGSRGVFRINDMHEFQKHLDDCFTYSKNHTIIIEEYIEGKEYIVDGLALDDEYINLDLGIKEYFNKEALYISKMCMFSSANVVTDISELCVLETNKKLVQGLKLKFGITHGEYIVSDKDKKVYLVEIAARGGGVYLSSDLTPWATGIDTNDIIIDYVLENKKISISSLNLDHKVSAWICFELLPGTIISIENIEELKKIKGVKKVFLDELFVGKKVEQLKDDTGKHGPILICGTSREDCYEIIKQVRECLKISVKNGKLVSQIIW